jgi:hypothetical protein
MDEKISALDKETIKALTDTLCSQSERALQAIFELDSKVTNINFLTNGGGAVAVLALLGTGKAPEGMEWTLVCFIVGLISTGIELRSLLSFFGDLHADAVRRYQGFLDGKLSVGECSGSEDIAKWKRRVNHISGWVAQGTFIIGAVVGVAIYICQ